MLSPTKNTTLTVVISRGQSRNPAKRGLETAVAEEAVKIDDVSVLVVPHLYDLPKDGESWQQLREIEGDLLVVSWIFPRAAMWVLDRNGVGGRPGEVLLDIDEEDGLPDDAAPVEDSESTSEPVDRVTDLFPRPDRFVYGLDLKTAPSVDVFLDEIKRIAGVPSDPDDVSLPVVGGSLQQIEETTSRRWYPVIDFSRCTNCMECIDFCLFGVYGVDGAETILVEQPDNCRKGCPACSRVCPENAIIFPQHKAPAIAGAETEGGEGFKIDLSLLFGKPAGDDDQIATAARERDEQLLLAGRDAVGMDDQLRKRQTSIQSKPKDQLDSLIDSLDDLDL
ncbi:MAG: ferredoxin family protein [Planctomycetota bacterium]